MHSRVGSGRGRPAVLRLDLASKRRDRGRAAGVAQCLLNGRQRRIRLGGSAHVISCHCREDDAPQEGGGGG
jgi:hypothetical protein